MSKTKSKTGLASKIKKWILSLSLPAIIASALTIGGTLALLLSVSDIKHNEFVPGNVDCEVVETFDGTYKSSIKIQNTGNTDAYIRVNFVSYVQNQDGEILGQSVSVPEFDLGENWSYAADGYYYYKLPVAPGALTGEMLASAMELVQKKDGNGNVIGNQVVEVFAEAIQAYPEDAVVNAWKSAVAVTGADDHLVVEVKVYENYLSAANYGARYRGFYVCSDKETDQWKTYHTGILNNDIVSDEDVITLTSDSNNQIHLSYYLINVIELKDFALYFTDATNVVSVMVYASDDEQIHPGEEHLLGAMTKSAVSGNYVSDVASEQELEYALSVNVTKHKRFATLIITTDGPQQSVTISEARLMGYMSHNNVAPASQYKGASDTTTVAFADADTGSDHTSWTEYHKGRLNDTTRSSAMYDEKPAEKIMVKSLDDTTDTIRIMFKLEQPALIDLVDAYIGALNLYGDPKDGKDSELYGDNTVTAFNVYVSETENRADWKPLGTDTTGVSNGEDTYLYIYSAADAQVFGQYVIIEIKGTAGQMYYGINEVQIWACASLDIDE